LAFVGVVVAFIVKKAREELDRAVNNKSVENGIEKAFLSTDDVIVVIAQEDKQIEVQRQ
jgi:hypothetical protein